MGISTVLVVFILNVYSPTEIIAQNPARTQTGCQKLSDTDLAQKLRDNGNYNEKYMAATLDEAARYFPDLTDTHFVRSAQRYVCDSDCQQKTDDVKRLLDGKGQQVDWPRVNMPAAPIPAPAPAPAPGGPIPPLDTSANVAGRRKRDGQRIKLDNIGQSYVLYCSPEGFEEQPGYHKLCAGCRSIRELPKDYFPRFLNEVRCSKTKCVREHGSCVQKYLNFDILRNEGTKDCQRWVPYTASVPICCDCMLSSQSTIFLSLVQRE